jgi:hypothetical protein
MKIIVNKCNHGFTLSEAQKELFPDGYVDRTDPRLIASFEAGDNRGDGGSTLVLMEIPDEADGYHIVENDGIETLYWMSGSTLTEVG